MKTRVTLASQADIQKANVLQRKLEAAQKKIREHNLEVLRKNCPFESGDVIQLPNGKLGVVADCWAFPDFLGWGSEETPYTHFHFSVRYRILNGKRVLRTLRTSVASDALVLIDKKPAYAREALLRTLSYNNR